MPNDTYDPNVAEIRDKAGNIQQYEFTPPSNRVRVLPLVTSSAITMEDAKSKTVVMFEVNGLWFWSSPENLLEFGKSMVLAAEISLKAEKEASTVQ